MRLSNITKEDKPHIERKINMSTFLKSLWENQWAKYAAVLLLGITVGAVFYPTKRIEEKVTKKYKEQISIVRETHSKEISKLTESFTYELSVQKTKVEETEKKVSKLVTENKELKSKQKISYYKLVKPDGTIEERQFTETEIQESSQVVTQIQEEYKSKVTEIENKWSTLHQQRVQEIKKDFDAKEYEYKSIIASYEKHKVTETNTKHFGLEVGVLNNKNYYGHLSYDIWGPIYIGVLGTYGSEVSTGGLGIGIRF